MNDHMLVAAGAWVLLSAAMLAWRRRAVHRWLVLVAVLADVGLVLHLQLTRDAVQQALGFERPALQQAHIAVSTVALLLYVPLLWFLARLLRGTATPRDRERYVRLLLPAYALRTLGFLLMFSMLGR